MKIREVLLMDMKLMTFNVQHCSAFYSRRIDYPLFAEVIRQSGARIVGLNETYGAGSSFGELAQAEYIARELGWYWYFAEAISIGHGRYGNSIVSEYPLKNVRTVPIPDPEPRGYDGYYETRCVLLCTADAEGAELNLAVTHFGLNPDEQRNAVDTLLPFLDTPRLILMGDLNVTPDDPLLDPIRARMTDTASLLTGNRFSFPSDKPECRIDYIFVSKDITPLAVRIPQTVASDHLPLIADVKIF